VTGFLRRPFEWLRAEWAAARAAAGSPKLQARLEEWRLAQTNDSEMLERDPDLQALDEATRLWRSDPKSGFPRLAALAGRGSIMSMLLVGLSYEQGTGVSEDRDLAEQWYRLAFEEGSQKGQLLLGQLYETWSEFTKCEQVYAVGADSGWAPGLYHLARMRLLPPRTPSRLEDARVLLEQAAAQGDLGAQIDLMRLLVRGRFGLRRIPSGLRLCFDTGRKCEALTRMTGAGRKPTRSLRP